MNLLLVFPCFLSSQFASFPKSFSSEIPFFLKMQKLLCLISHIVIFPVIKQIHSIDNHWPWRRFRPMKNWRKELRNGRRRILSRRNEILLCLWSDSPSILSATGDFSSWYKQSIFDQFYLLIVPPVESPYKWAIHHVFSNLFVVISHCN